MRPLTLQYRYLIIVSYLLLQVDIHANWSAEWREIYIQKEMW